MGIFTFFKLYKWYQIVQRITIMTTKVTGGVEEFWKIIVSKSLF